MDVPAWMPGFPGEEMKSLLADCELPEAALEKHHRVGLRDRNALPHVLEALTSRYQTA